MINNKNKTNNLYHYTCLFRLKTIADAGYLKLTDVYVPYIFDKCIVKFTIPRKQHYKYWNVWKKQ